MMQQTIGEVLKEHREAKGLSMRKAAAEADLDQAVVSRIENGRRLPNKAQLTALAEVYGVGLESLLTINAFSEVKQRYGDTEYYANILELLNEDAAGYNDNCE